MEHRGRKSITEIIKEHTENMEENLKHDLKSLKDDDFNPFGDFVFRVVIGTVISLLTIYCFFSLLVAIALAL